MLIDEIEFVPSASGGHYQYHDIKLCYQAISYSQAIIEVDWNGHKQVFDYNKQLTLNENLQNTIMEMVEP